MILMMTRARSKDQPNMAHLAVGIHRRRTKFAETNKSCTKDVILLVTTISIITVIVTKGLVFFTVFVVNGRIFKQCVNNG